MAIIGEAEVQIRADVRRLGRDITDSFDGLDDQLDQIADRMSKSIGDSLQKSIDGLTLRPELDMDRILDQLGDLESMLGDIATNRVNVDVDVDQAAIDRTVNSINSIADDVNIPNITPSIEIDADKVSDDLRDAIDRANAIADKYDIDIQVDVDADNAIENLERLQSQLESDLDDIELGASISQSDIEEINATLEALRAYNEANDIEIGVDVHIARAMASLALLTRTRVVQIIPVVSGKIAEGSQNVLAGLTGFNIMREHMEDFIRSITELDKALPGLAAQLALISAVVPTAGWGAGWLVTMIGDVASLTGLLVPGAAALTAYGTAALYMGNAFSKSNLDKYVPEVGKQFKNLSEIVAGDFWAIAAPSYRQFAFDTLPALYEATKSVNTGMAVLTSTFYDSIASVVESERGLSNISTISDNISKAMGGLGEAFEPALQGLLTFVRVGSEYLPALGDAITGAAERFDAWVQEMDKSGQLQEWADAGITALQELWSIVVNTVGIFRTLYDVASFIGFPGLTELAEGFRQVNDALSSAEGIHTLTQYGDAVNTAFTNIADSLGWVVPVLVAHSDEFTSAIETMGEITGGILDGIGDMFTNTNLVSSALGLFDSMKIAVDEFRPAFEAIGRTIAVTFDFMGSALENITPVLTVFFENIANDAENIKPAFMGMLDIIGEWGPRVMEVVGEVTFAITTFIGEIEPGIALVGLAFLGALPAIASFGGALFTFARGLGNVIDDVGRLVGAIKASPTATLLLSNSLGGAGKAAGLLGRAIGVLSGPIGWVIGAFISAFTASEDLRREVGEFLVNVFKTLAAFIAPIIPPLMEFVGVVGQIAAEIGQKLAPIFTSLFGVLNSLMPVFQALAFVAGTVLGNAFRALGVILQAAWNIIGPFIDGLVSIGSGVLDGAIVGINAIVDAFKQFASGDILGGLSTLADGFIDAMATQFQGVGDGIITLLTSGITSGLENLKLILPEAGAEIIQGLIDGFTSAVDRVRQWLQDLTQSIIDWKGPPSTDATLLTPAGESIIQSLINGFTNAVQAVFTFLQNLTQQIVNTVMNMVNGVINIFSTGWSMLTTIVSAVWNGIQAVITTVLTGISTTISTILTGISNVISIIWTGIQVVITTVLNTIRGIISTVFGSIQTIISTVWNSISATVNVVWTTIKTLINLALQAIKALFTGNFAQFKAIISVAWNVIRTATSTVWNIIKNAISSVLNTIRSTISNVFNAIRNTINTVMSVIRNIINAVWNAIRSTVTNVVNGIRNTISTVFAVIRNVITSVMNAIRSITSSVWNGIRSTISSVISSIRSTISSGMSTARNVISSAWNAVRSLTSSIWSSVISTVRSKISSMISTIRGIPGQARSALGNLGSTLVSAGRNLIQGLINGVTGKISALRSKLNEVTNLIPSWKGPPEKDATLLTNAGELIMQGFIDGLESKYGRVKNSLTSFTGGLSNQVNTELGADIGLSTSVRRTALSDAERRLSYRSAQNSMVQSNGTDGPAVIVNVNNSNINEQELVTIIDREFGRGV